jgi:SAM-dependent methyltransferase
MSAPTAEGPNADQIAYWNAQAGETWVKLQPRLDAQIEALGGGAIDALAPQAGERIIDIGCGAGASSMELARRVGPSGHVLGVDISAPLQDLARRRAAAAGLDGRLQFALGDAQIHPFEPGAADGVFSRFGVMFFADPVAAFANLRRALKPGGRLAFLCWQAASANPCFTLPMAAAVAGVPEFAPPADAAPPAPGAPGPFAFADPDRVRSILGDAGFHDIAVRAQAVALSLGQIDEAVNVTIRVGPLASRLRENAHLAAPVAAAVRDALARQVEDGEVRVGSATWIVTAKA